LSTDGESYDYNGTDQCCELTISSDESDELRRDSTYREQYDCWASNEIANATKAETFDVIVAMVLAGFWLFILAVALPGYLFRRLSHESRLKRLHEPEVSDRFGYLYAKYKDRSFYYELLCLESRKSRVCCWHLGCILPRVPAMIVRAGVLLIMSGILLTTHVTLSQCLCMAIILANLVAHHWLQPFKRDTLRVSLNQQAGVALGSQLSAVVLGLIATLTGAGEPDASPAAAAVLSVGSVVSMMLPIMVAVVVKQCPKKNQGTTRRSWQTGIRKQILLNRVVVKQQAPTAATGVELNITGHVP